MRCDETVTVIPVIARMTSQVALYCFFQMMVRDGEERGRSRVLLPAFACVCVSYDDDVCPIR